MASLTERKPYRNLKDYVFEEVVSEDPDADFISTNFVLLVRRLSCSPRLSIDL